MSDRALVGTRKGLFTLNRGSSGWEIAKVDFLATQVTYAIADPRDGTLYAGIKHEHFGPKMHRSDDRGQTWKEIATPVYPEKPEGYVEAAPMEGTPAPWKLMQIWSVAPGGPGQAGLVWTGTIPGGLFVSRDRGDSWDMVRTLWDLPERQKWFGGGADQPGIHSICVDPRDSSRVTLGVSCGGVWATEDCGETWKCRADGMWANYLPPEMKGDPNLQDPHCVAQSPSNPDVMWAQHHNAVFKTTDGGARWEEIMAVQPSNFGFPVAVHPRDPDTAWTVPATKDECRLPVDGKVVVARTRNGGRSFDVLRNGLPQDHAYDLVYRHCLDVNSSGDRLMMGSTTGSLWATEDQGDRWTCISSNLPPIYSVRFAD